MVLYENTAYSLDCKAVVFEFPTGMRGENVTALALLHPDKNTIRTEYIHCTLL